MLLGESFFHSSLSKHITQWKLGFAAYDRKSRVNNDIDKLGRILQSPIPKLIWSQV